MKHTASAQTHTSANQPEESLRSNSDYEQIDTSKLSEMMKRYVEVKQQYPHALLLFRVGDFFECFFQDAVTIAQQLELVQTSKHAGKQIGKVPMTGVPHHALEKYAAMLVEKGFAVVVCDQVEDASIAAKENRQVKREIVRILTPGTLTDDGMLKPRYNNYLAAVAMAKNHWGLAFTDVSTGEFLTTQSDNLEQLTQELMRLQPSEILYPTNAPDIGTMLRPGEKSKDLPECLPNSFCYSFRPQFPFTQAEARERLLEKFQLSSLEGLGCENLTLGVRAAGGLLEYLEDTQKQNQVPLQRLRTYTISDYLILDYQSRRNLEITQTVRDGSFHGSFLWAIDKTCTAMGGRALRRWLLQPLLGLKGIRSRHDTIQELVENIELRQDIQQLLRQIYDLERLAGRAGAGTANARDLVALADSMAKLPDLATLASRGRSPYLKVLQKMPSIVEQLAEIIHSHLVESPPQHLKEGGIIRLGVNKNLDEMRQLAQDDLEWVQNLEATERERTGITNLKVGYNKAFGYYISILKSKIDLAPPEYTRKQTLTNEERYITEELKEREVRILNAREDLNQLEYDIFVSLREEVGESAEEIRNISRAVAAIDVLCGLAEIASDRDYCRPTMLASRELTIIQGRHPVVEKSLPAGFFVPNTAILGSGEHDTREDTRQMPTSHAPETDDTPEIGSAPETDSAPEIDSAPETDDTPEIDSAPETDDTPVLQRDRPDLIILTGPNASGKSCYLRQVGLIQLMAQIGSFVPATSAKLGICDRIFTRVGAVDDLATGQSTFMVEMNETANILNHATPKSLVLLDEIGRGTATFDGLSIAWSVAEYLAAEISSRTIFATHYHELNELASILDNVANYQVTVKELPDKIVFLHQVQSGGADKSYGIEAGRLAGLPTSVIKRAKQVMKQIEKHSKIAMGLRKGIKKKKNHRNLPKIEQLDIFEDDF